jgi:hypothetical protein
MHTRTPPDNPASPRYAPVGITAIAMLTGEPRGQTESDQASKNAIGRMYACVSRFRRIRSSVASTSASCVYGISSSYMAADSNIRVK